MTSDYDLGTAKRYRHVKRRAISGRVVSWGLGMEDWEEDAMFGTLNRIALFALCSAAIVSLLLPVPRAFAQVAALEEIVVTARKREEALVDIPFAVSAFSEEELNASNLKNFADMQLFTPGLTYQQATANRADRGVPNIVIRGLNINAFSGSSVAALMFVDGAPVLGGEIGSFVDVVRVEVLRGPQTAYFGRNTFSGAVNLVTKDPGEEFGGSVGLDFDRFGTADLQLSVEGPIIADRLSIRLSGRSNKKGGHYKNNRNGAREIGDEDTRSLVATLLATPTDTLRFKLRLEDIEINDGPQPAMRFPSSYANCDANGNGSASYRCGLPPDVSVAEFLVGHNDAFAAGYLPRGSYVSDVIEAFSLYSDSSPRQIDGEGVFIDKMGLAKLSSGATFSAAAELPGGMTLDWISGYNETKSMIVSDENTLPRAPFSPIADTFLVERWSENSSHEGTAFFARRRALALDCRRQLREQRRCVFLRGRVVFRAKRVHLPAHTRELYDGRLRRRLLRCHRKTHAQRRNALSERRGAGGIRQPLGGIQRCGRARDSRIPNRQRSHGVRQFCAGIPPRHIQFHRPDPLRRGSGQPGTKLRGAA